MYPYLHTYIPTCMHAHTHTHRQTRRRRETRHVISSHDQKNSPRCFFQLTLLPNTHMRTYLLTPTYTHGEERSLGGPGGWPNQLSRVAPPMIQGAEGGKNAAAAVCMRCVRACSSVREPCSMTQRHRVVAAAAATECPRKRARERDNFPSRMDREGGRSIGRYEARTTPRARAEGELNGRQQDGRKTPSERLRGRTAVDDHHLAAMLCAGARVRGRAGGG